MSIERLPDELWLEIFSYISYAKLFHCFLGLNKRINSILYSKQIKLKLKTNQMYEKSKFIMETLSEYIDSLCIEYYNQIIDISQFKNLLSLHISHPTYAQVLQIGSNYFEYLNELKIVVFSAEYLLGDMIFSKDRLNYLTTCWFPSLDFYFQDDIFYEPCFTLRSLRLNYSHMNTFFRLLQFLPNLSRFESAFVELPVSYQSVVFSLIYHLNLVYMKISLRAKVSLNNLDVILACVPRLEQLYLNIDGPNINAEDFNLARLTNILESRVANIKKYDIKINLFSSNLRINRHDFKNS